MSFGEGVGAYKSLGDPDVGEGRPGEAEVALDVLADDGLLVVAGHVVPLDAVPVEVVQHRQARLGVASLLGLLSVIRLGTTNTAGSRPVVEGRVGVGGR